MHPTKPLRRTLPSREQRSAAATAELVTMEPLTEGERLPLLVRPAADGVDLVAWARANRERVESLLDVHGGILFRGFGRETPEQLRELAEALSDAVLEYEERSSPRSQVSGKVYTSTDHPADAPIFLHNEHSYALTFPRKIFFQCAVPATSRGATPIADSRRIHDRIDPEVRRRFEERGYAYVRNYGDGVGLTWQEAFQTEDPAAVDAYARDHGIEVTWKEGGRLRTRQVRRAVARHPRTGEPTWFNHATFFHVSTLDAGVARALLAGLGEENLPNHTYYGDGTPIEPEVMDHLRAAYDACTLTFPWQQGDVLMLDNMLTAHGREPFEGPRKVLTVMSDPVRWDDLSA